MNLFNFDDNVPEQPSFYWENIIEENGYNVVAGIDEAGRGPLSGPVIAVAVIINGDIDFLSELDDSKKITERKRHLIYKKIISCNEIILGIGGASSK